MLKVISILGKKGHGKDYISKLIGEEIFRSLRFKSKEIAFADKVKEVLSVLTGIPVKKFHSQEFKTSYMINLKNFSCIPIDGRLSTINSSTFNEDLFKQKDIWISIRELMQYFGTDIMHKAFGKRVWVNATLQELDYKKVNIFTDTRFISEYKVLKDLDAVTIRVVNPNINNEDSHPSETELDDYPADYTIINDWSSERSNINFLNEQVNAIVKDLILWE